MHLWIICKTFTYIKTIEALKEHILFDPPDATPESKREPARHLVPTQKLTDNQISLTVLDFNLC